MPFGRIPLHNDALPFDVAQTPQFREERPPRSTSSGFGDHVGREYRSDDRDPSWLCQVLRQRGSACGRKQQTDCEIPTPHSMTSSARARIDGGTVRPSALAVLKLTTSSNIVGCWTGRSAGFTPARIFPA